MVGLVVLIGVAFNGVRLHHATDRNTMRMAVAGAMRPKATKAVRTAAGPMRCLASLKAEEVAKAVWLAKLEAEPTWLSGVSETASVAAVPADTNPTDVLQKLEPVQLSFHHPQAGVLPINSMVELDAALQAAGNGVCIVKFYAPHCRTCKAIKPKFERAAKMHVQHTYLEVNAGVHRNIARLCGVNTVPYVQFYANGRLLKEMGLDLRAFPKFERLLDDGPPFAPSPEAEELVKELTMRVIDLRRAGRKVQ